MSILKTIYLQHLNGAAPNATLDANGNMTVTGTVAGAYSDMFRNRIINGDMRIDQRNAGAAVTASNSYPVDRFQIINSTDGAYSAQQDTSAPAGFVNSIKITTTTADTNLTTTQNFQFRQIIEGTNISDLAWGTVNAKTVTISFWVRSSLTGTFGGSLINSTVDRSYPFTYTISNADSWEYKTVTILGDTTGTWLTTTSAGVYLVFSLGSGPDRAGTAGSWSSNIYTTASGATASISTLNATWYITGVQLEVGTMATPFERRPYGMELALCQRYYWRAAGANAGYGIDGLYATAAGNGLRISWPHPVPMRAAPTANASFADLTNCTVAFTTTLTGFAITLNTTGSGRTGAQMLSNGYISMDIEL